MSRTPARRRSRLGWLVPVAALAALVLVGACGGTDTETPAAPAAEDHNRADVTFAQQMIPHHMQALMMARLAETNDAGPEVQALADRIEDAQTPEIEQMSQWLEEWGEDSGPGSMGMGPDDMAGMGDMPGMLGPGEMRSLARARGGELDRLFLTLMIEHHEGAVEMAREEMAEGRHRGTIALAVAIEESQTAEIAEMREMLAG